MTSQKGKEGKGRDRKGKEIPRGGTVGFRGGDIGGDAVCGGCERSHGIVHVVMDLQRRRHEEIHLRRDLGFDAGRAVVSNDYAVRGVADGIAVAVDEKRFPDA